MKIVIIEDEQDLGVLMRNFLIKQLNIKIPDKAIRIASSLAEGIDCVAEISPDWVFIDNNLPDGKGINEIPRIKRATSNKKTWIVMMSAMTNLREEAFRLGADYFLDKPISFVEVRNILKDNHERSDLAG